MASGPATISTDAAILTRLIRPEQTDLLAEAARVLLDLRLDPSHLDRLHDLTVRNQDDALSVAELGELASYIRISAFLDLMQAKARLSLRPRIDRSLP